ncbi:hypothetical protein Pint_09946 [Pistacia integerrima]|uniref:Uncharacterized protein n=1 Tax=Pistacia integerrima TaxID=434235 RepID=A0ACC0XIC7_9ROSI|nr:hypothetical protein Pint_09946 [Pistacia integerrima]
MKGELEGENKKEKFDPEKHIDAYLPVRVNEQRVSNLLQSLSGGSSVRHACHQANSYISSLGLFCLHVHRQSPREPILGKDATTIHYT